MATIPPHLNIIGRRDIFMNKQPLNESTRKYLQAYFDILDRMIRAMTQAELEDSISHNVIVVLIPLCLAGVEMSENILGYTNEKMLISIAENIISEETECVEDMRNIIDKCTQKRNNARQLCQYQSRTDEIIQTMFTQMRTTRADNRQERNFIREMIPRNRGAVSLCTNAIRFGVSAELKPILNKMIMSHKKIIMQLQRVMQLLGCK